MDLKIPLDDKALGELDERLHFHHRLDAAHHTLEHALEHVVMADNKALIALTFQGAIIAGAAALVGTMGEIIATAFARHSLPVQILSICFGALFLTGFLISTWTLFQAISPRMKPTGGDDATEGLFFFGTIAHMDPDAFAHRRIDLEPRDIHYSLLKMAHVTSTIAVEKPHNLHTAYRYLFLQIVAFVACAVLLALPGPL